MNQDPRCAELEDFLRTLEPRQELIRRWALGQLYPVCARDGKWHQREKALLAMLFPYDEDEFAAMLIAAREIAAGLRKELSQSA